MSPQQIQTVGMVATLAVWVVFMLQVTPIMVWIERRGAAMMQDRPGPNRVGPLGLFQSLADALKFMFKESIVPEGADKPLFLMAPLLALIPALTTYTVIPLGPAIQVAGQRIGLTVVPADTGVLLLLALSSLGIYSLIIAGYSSNSKYSLFGALRASAQMISYELALTLAVVAVLLPVGSLRLDEVVTYQQTRHLWNCVPQALGLFVFIIASFAETNRAPFDLPEAESELVAGYHTEYGGMKFALFFMGEYMAMAALSALAATLYFGGWTVPGVDLFKVGDWIATLPLLGKVPGPIWTGLIAALVLFTKVFIALLFFVWVRWSFPRYRFDQLLRLGWKVLLPLSIVNLLLIAVLTLKGVL
ncbi:MAG: NADH-quinone oxidoreductase subunit NuoH [Acidobacteriota bacterium]